MKTNFILIIAIFVLVTCQSHEKKSDSLTSEILSVEKAFNQRVAEEGIKEAFLFYADENAVLLRNNKLIKGKDKIENFYSAFDENRVKLTWKPDFVEVSESGDLAYTYGKYQFQSVDSEGKKNVSEGIFHTVWKKQNDGSWKYVWD